MVWRVLVPPPPLPFLFVLSLPCSLFCLSCFDFCAFQFEGWFAFWCVSVAASLGFAFLVFFSVSRNKSLGFLGKESEEKEEEEEEVGKKKEKVQGLKLKPFSSLSLSARSRARGGERGK